MKIEKWVQDSAGRLDAVVLLDAGEKPSTVQVLEFVDRQAGAEKSGCWDAQHSKEKITEFWS